MGSGGTSYDVLRPSADILLAADTGLKELYDLKRELSGSQSGCMLAVDKKTGVAYALQESQLADLDPIKCQDLVHAIAAQRRIRDDQPADIVDEMKTARLACVREVLLSPSRLILINELQPIEGALCEDLFTLLQQRGHLEESDARRIFTRIAVAIKRAHECGSVLRNIKPEIVQVRQQTRGGEFEVCLSQLHCAACVPRGDDVATLAGLVGTPEYAAPEVVIWYWFECEPPRLPEPPPPYGSKADIWALGMCLHVMLCGCFPFPASLPEEDLLRTINTAGFQFNDPGWRKVSEDALDLVSQLLQRDPLDRPFLEEVLQHPFCSESYQEALAAEERLAKLEHLDTEAFDRALDLLDGDEDEPAGN